MIGERRSLLNAAGRRHIGWGQGHRCNRPGRNTAHVSNKYPLPAFYITRQGRGLCVRAHRCALALATGEPLGSALALHECDVPVCVKVAAPQAIPEHVVAGTQRDNMIGMAYTRRGGGRPVVANRERGFVNGGRGRWRCVKRFATGATVSEWPRRCSRGRPDAVVTLQAAGRFGNEITPWGVRSHR